MARGTVRYDKLQFVYNRFLTDEVNYSRNTASLSADTYPL